MLKKDESSWLAVAGHIYMWIFFFFGDAALFYACISISYLVWLDADTWPLYIGSFFISLILVFFIALLTICMCHIVDIFINLFSIMRSRTGQGTQGRKKRLLRDRLLEYLRSVLPLSIFDSPGLPLFLDYPEEKNTCESFCASTLHPRQKTSAVLYMQNRRPRLSILRHKRNKPRLPSHFGSGKKRQCQRCHSG